MRNEALLEPYQQTWAGLQWGTGPAAPALSPVLLMRLDEIILLFVLTERSAMILVFVFITKIALVGWDQHDARRWLERVYPLTSGQRSGIFWLYFKDHDNCEWGRMELSRPLVAEIRWPQKLPSTRGLQPKPPLPPTSTLISGHMATCQLFSVYWVSYIYVLYCVCIVFSRLMSLPGCRSEATVSSQKLWNICLAGDTFISCINGVDGLLVLIMLM